MTPQAQTWRTTVVGAALIAFALLRIYVRHEALWETETVGFVSGGCALILGSDKLLGK